MMQESKTQNPALKAISLELNMSFGNCFTFFAPLVAKAPEPFPTLMFIILGFGSMFLITKMDKQPEKMSLELSILSMVMDGGVKELSNLPLKSRVEKWKGDVLSESSKPSEF